MHHDPNTGVITYEEGDDCPDCGLGSLEYVRQGDCSCHISPPCRSCVEAPLVCTKCEHVVSAGDDQLKVTTYNARPLKAADDMLACLNKIRDELSEIEEAVNDCYVRAETAIYQAEKALSGEPAIVGYVVSNPSGSYDQEKVFPTYDEALCACKEGDAIGAVLSDNTVTFEV